MKAGFHLNSPNKKAKVAGKPIRGSIMPPIVSPVDSMVLLQQTIGNQAVGKLIQTKFKIGQTNARQHQSLPTVRQNLNSLSRLPQEIIQRQEVTSESNYRFDNYQVTASDLNDSYIISRFNSMSVTDLRKYQQRVSDAGVVSYLSGLIESKLKSAKNMERESYLSDVKEAIKQMNDKFLGEKTLSNVLFPMFERMAQKDNVAWKDELGNETPGKSITYRPLGKSAKKIKLKLLLDETVPQKDTPRGHYDDSQGIVRLFVKRCSTVDAIRETLFHEGIHASIAILQTMAPAKLGNLKDTAIQALSTAIAMTDKVKSLILFLTNLSDSVNKVRRKQGKIDITSDEIETTAKFLWEEILVRAETFYFELLHWMDKRQGTAPAPNYLEEKNVKYYLRQSGTFTDDDFTNLAAKDHIQTIRNFLRCNMRMLIKRRGVTNQYVPHPSEPKAILVTGVRAKIPLGPMGEQYIEPSFLKEIEESAKTLP